MNFSISKLRAICFWQGRVGAVFFFSLLVSFLPIGDWALPFRAAAFLTGIWLFIRFIRWTTHQAIWRLRNRLLVTYTFIAVVPLALVLMMVAISAYLLMSQITVYLVSTELDRRVEILTSAAETLAVMEAQRRENAVDRMFDLYYKQRFQGMQVVLRERDSVSTYPKDLAVEPPPRGFGDVSGIVMRNGGQLYGWAHRNTPHGDVTVTAPLSPQYLGSLLPQMGVFELYWIAPGEDPAPGRENGKRARRFVLAGNRKAADRDMPAKADVLPPPANRFDVEVSWPRTIPTWEWSQPSKEPTGRSFLQIHTRPSLLLNSIFSLKSDDLQGLPLVVLLTVGVLFLIVQIIALVIGTGMTRTITSAVHALYEGTQRVKAGDFSHRIAMRGSHQLAELAASFNKMTENVQHLLTVAKEKERLQSELEIAREVQGQLFPKSHPEVKDLALRAVCQPARMVSGDYFDYDGLPGQRIAFAMGDVAGKGISAALLMASLQSLVRSQWAHSIENAKVAADGLYPRISTSTLVSRLNQQLYKNTAPEKYATFFLGVYDPTTKTLCYTNAGHLPPLLFRGSTVTRLEIDGTVVGAFPFAEYGESTIQLEPGDLLVCYTDGITEPENAYGEMFDEHRLIEVVQKNLQKPEVEIVQSVMEAVFQWTGSPELQDDMTVLLARQS